jgi:hypothetical protein
LWTELEASAEHEWLRQSARRALLQLDAEAILERLQPIVNGYYDRVGRFPSSWDEVVRARVLAGVPVDPTGVPYALDPVSGAVNVDQRSPLYPLRGRGPVK